MTAPALLVMQTRSHNLLDTALQNIAVADIEATRTAIRCMQWATHITNKPHLMDVYTGPELAVLVDKGIISAGHWVGRIVGKVAG